MNDDPAALIDALEKQGAALRILAQEIAEEIAQGRAMQMIEIDKRRAKIVQVLQRLAMRLRDCATIPAGMRNTKLRSAVTHYRAQSGLWANLDHKLCQHFPPRSYPLSEPPTKQATNATIRQDAADRLLEVLHFALKADQGQTEAAYAFGCHDDIALPASRFFDAVHAAYRVVLAQGRGQGAAFLDVGCGNGLKLLSAQPYFTRCHGLEYQDTSVKAAQQVLAKSRVTGCAVFEGDGLTLEQYGDYQVIYLFRPMRDPAVLMALEDRILAQVAPGTVIIAPYQSFRDRSAEVGCGWITTDVFVTGLDQLAADALREEAEHIGLGLRQSKLATASVWDPIIQAAEARGVALSPFRAERVG